MERIIQMLFLVAYVILQAVVHVHSQCNIQTATGGPWDIGGNNKRINGKWTFTKPSGTFNSATIKIIYQNGIYSMGNFWSCQETVTHNLAASPPTTTLTYFFKSWCQDSTGKYVLNFADYDYDSSKGSGNIVSFLVNDKAVCGTAPTPSPLSTPPPPTSGSGTCNSGHDYKNLLELSMLFYKAQRSGHLPDNSVPWRKDSFLQVAQGLTGGYFDAGDYVKFGFPGASTITVLAWGMVEFKDGYQYAGLYNKGLETLKWQTDYFLKCKKGSTDFYVQCGDGNLDHSYWGRPEDYNKEYPCYKIDANNPGSEVAAETAAALAATSIAFKSNDASYSATLLKHAIELYNFANNYKGTYSNSIPYGNDFYKSYSGYYDELAWAAAWLYKGTGTSSYLTDALSHWNKMEKGAPTFSWDNKGRGVAVLLSDLASSPFQYKNDAKYFCETYIQGVQKTYRGTAFLTSWGSNRASANAAFICLVFSKYHSDTAPSVKQFAKAQIESLLGDKSKNIRSHVVGYGHNPPDRPHHRSSSCPSKNVDPICDWNDFNSPDANPHVLKGALIGGPKATNDIFVDDRKNYVTNEVALDYNSGFQSALAAILSLHRNNKC